MRILRLVSHAYIPCMARGSLYGSGSQALPALIRKAIHHPAEPFTIWGSGLQYRDFLYLDDAVSGILAVPGPGE